MTAFLLFLSGLIGGVCLFYFYEIHLLNKILLDGKELGRIERKIADHLGLE